MVSFTRQRYFITSPLAVVYPDSTLKEALDLMAEMDVNRLPLVNRSNPRKLEGILSRKDILKERRRYLKNLHLLEKNLPQKRTTKDKVTP